MDPGTLPDPNLVKTACDLFARYGSEIVGRARPCWRRFPKPTPQAKGPRCSLKHSQLVAGRTLSTKRIRATAQFVNLGSSRQTMQSAPVR